MLICLGGAIHLTHPTFRVAPGFPLNFARRSLESVERQRRERDHFLLDVNDDRALVLPISSSAPPPPAQEDESPYLSGRVAHDVNELFWTVTMDSLDGRTRARVRSRGVWSVPPPDPNQHVQLQRRTMSASPQVDLEVEPRHPPPEFSSENRQLRDSATEPFPPFERPPLALRVAFRINQHVQASALLADAWRQGRIDLIEAWRRRQTGPGQRQMSDLRNYSPLVTYLGLSPDMDYLLQMARDGVSDRVLGENFRRYLEVRRRRLEASQQIQNAPPGLQFGDAPYIEPLGRGLRTPAVAERISQWQQRNQQIERATSRQPAAQPPQENQGREASAPRDSVSREVVEEDKRDDSESVEGGEGVA